METYDDILEISGKFGRYQWRTYFFVCVALMQASMLTFTQVFIGATADFWCRGSKFETDACLSESLSVADCERLKKVAVCINHNFTFYEEEDELRGYVDTMQCQNDWVFDHSVHKSTFTEEWGLVCDNSAMPNILQSIYLAGLLFGCIVFGTMADRFGRSKTFKICLLCEVVFTLLSALSPNPIIFGIIRFCVGASVYGLTLVVFVTATEMVLPTTRVYVGVTVWCFFSLGFFILSVLGKFISSWRLFIVATAAPFLLMAPSILYFEESPRWLITKRRFKDADRIIRGIAKTNGRTVPTDYISEIRESKEETSSVAFWDAIRNPVLRIYFLNLIFNWFVQSFVYYGLSLSTSNLGFNVFVAFCISGAVEMPAHAFSVVSMKYLGRRISTGGIMILGGLVCFATILSPPGFLRVTFAMIGKFAISASYDNVYILTAEIFPTPIRSRSVGTCSVAARVGGIVAPLILVLETVWASLPLVLFASSSVLAGLLVFFLPETKGRLMPDTIEDSLNLRKPLGSDNDNTEKT